MLQASSYALSHCGNIRDHNEDALFSDDEAGIWLLADGMGGHAGGEVASHLAVSAVSSALKEGATAEKAITSAHQLIIDQGEEHQHHKGMGTTLVAVQREATGFRVSWVGDSRAYYYDGKLQQLTTDHTFVQDMVYREVLTPDEAEVHPQRSLLVRSLGMLKGLFSVDCLTLRPKASRGILLLCSDGVSDYLSKIEIESIVATTQSPKALPEAIKEAVLSTEAGDNLSVIVIDFKLPLKQRLSNCFTREITDK